MKPKQPYQGVMAALILSLTLVLGSGPLQPAQAGTEDAAMFYEELAQHGEWVDYESYGPVWHPTQVDPDWRPYVNGRWVPTEQGQIFETQEPWGWATYHYGNWMPTTNYGWVWVPGRTWYPSTVTWRTSPETTPVNDSYVGWAPVPPPNYVPPPEYAPASYYPGSPVSDLVTAPMYVFAAAASFLLGFGQPYTPAYSYGGCGCLAPPAYVPVIYPMAPLLPSFYAPTYYPPAFFGAGVGMGYGAYSFGPGPTYISRVTNINKTVINNTIINNTNNIVNIRNVRAPHTAITRTAALGHIQPPALTRGTRLPPVRPVTNVRRAEANLGKPNIVPPPKNIPPLRAPIPKATAAVAHTKGVPGAGLPPKATKPLTPAQQAQIHKLPAGKQIKPVTAPLSGKPTTPTHGKPGVATTTPGAKPGVGPTAPGAKPGVTPTHKPGVATTTPGARPGVGPTAPGAKPGVTPTHKPGVATTTPGAKPGVTPPTTTTRPGGTPPTTTKPKGGVPLPPGYKGLSPAERQKLEQEHQRLQHGGKPSGQPPAGTFQPGSKPGGTTPRSTGPSTYRPGATPPTVSKPSSQPPSGYKPPTTGPGYQKPGTQPTTPPKVTPRPPTTRPTTPPTTRSTPPTTTPQRVAPRPQPTPQRVAPQPRPQPAPQRAAPPPQARPQPAPQRVAPPPRPAAPPPAPQPKPQPQKQPQKQKKPGEQ